jgi:diguanylate cyclase (GGDEF)-like protein
MPTCDSAQLPPDRARRWLSWDPLTVLRLLRTLGAPMQQAAAYGPWSIARICEEAGPSLLRRAVDVPTVDTAGSDRLRQLWLHSLATAFAARELARDSELMDPEEAYLMGLLHDVGAWFRHLARRGSTHLDISLEELLELYAVPGRMRRELVAKAALEQHGQGWAATLSTPSTLLCAASMLAELAGLSHPDGDASRIGLLEGASAADRGIGQRIRQELEADLLEEQLQLPLGEPELDARSTTFSADLAWLQRHRRPSTSDVLLRLLGDKRATTHRSIVTATTAAAVRHLGYDRAVYATWPLGSSHLLLRAKTDLSARGLTNTRVELSEADLQVLGSEWNTGRPIRLATPRTGICRFLGVDELVIAPIQQGAHVRTLVLADRALTARPMALLEEADLLQSLAITTGMLGENLLLRRSRDRAEKFALTDPLTRLFNRRMGITSLDQEVARAHRNGTALTLLMIDLDEFKKLNDTYGHVKGDAALRATAEVLRRTMRKGDTVCRYGGEEFLVVLPGTKAEDAAILAARLFTAVAAHGDTLDLPLTVSIGQSSIRPGDTPEALLHRADHALYASKSLGRNRFSVDVDFD